MLQQQTARCAALKSQGSTEASSMFPGLLNLITTRPARSRAFGQLLVCPVSAHRGLGAGGRPSTLLALVPP